jgi:hypothetical protein
MKGLCEGVKRGRGGVIFKSWFYDPYEGNGAEVKADAWENLVKERLTGHLII